MKFIFYFLFCFCLNGSGSVQALARGIGPQCPENRRAYNCTLSSGKNGVCAELCHVPQNQDAEFCCHVKGAHWMAVYFCCEQEEIYGRFSPAGGIEAEPDEFPYMVALGWFSPVKVFEFDFKCGGVLINAKFAITAAHCAYVDGVEPNMVLPGGVNLVNNTALRHTIDRVFVHPDYDEDFIYNDIALILLIGNYTDKTLDIWRRPYIPNTNFTAIGYGDTTFGGTSSEDLLKVYLQHFMTDDCQTYYESEELMPRGVLDTQICARDARQIMDTCQGDSGGPLIMTVCNHLGSKKEYLMGITSFGQGCALSPPGVYTKVSAYMGWISNVTRPWRPAITNRNGGGVYWT